MISVSEALTQQKNDSEQQASFLALKQNLISGAWDEQTRKKKQEQAKIFIENALFLEKDPQRKKRWIINLSVLSLQELENLIQAIIRENIRYKKRERDIVIELNKKQTQISIA